MNIGDDAKDKAMSLGDNIIEQKIPEEYRSAAKIGL